MTAEDEQKMRETCCMYFSGRVLRVPSWKYSKSRRTDKMHPTSLLRVTDVPICISLAL